MFKRKRLSVLEADVASGWEVAESAYDGARLVVRVNRSFARARDRRGYPIRIGIAVPLVEPDADGLPGPAELEQLGAIEDRIVEDTQGLAVLAVVLTTGATREFVLHAATSDWIEPFHLALEQTVVSHDVQVVAQTDPGWDVYEQFLP